MRYQTRMYSYDEKTKMQSSQYRFENGPRPKEVARPRSENKVVLTDFFVPSENCCSWVHQVVLRRLRKSVWRKRPERWQESSSRQCTGPYFTTRTAVFCQECDASVSPTSVFSRSCDPFSRDWGRVERGSVSKKESLTQLSAQTIPMTGFEKCFEVWRERSHNCVASGSS